MAKNKSNKRRALIYARYILPLCIAAIFLVLMLVPYIRFKDTEAGGLRGAVSLLELMGNSWDTVVEYMFGTANTNAANMDFSRTVMACIVVLWVLFAIGVASMVYALVAAFSYFGDKDNIKRRVLFVTLTCNRAVLCVMHALTLVPFIFPIILPYFYMSIFKYTVEAVYIPFNMLYIALGLYALMAVLVVISKRYEMLEGMNIYTKVKAAAALEQDIEEDGEDEEEELDPYELMNERTKAEQAERIRRLLAKDQDTDEDK